MINSHNLVHSAQALVDLTKKYLLEIQTNEDWSLKSEEFIERQTRIVMEIQKVGIDSLSVEEKKTVQELFRVCYQLELQIHNEITRQHSILSEKIGLLRIGNKFKNKYEAHSFQSGIMLDTYN